MKIYKITEENKVIDGTLVMSRYRDILSLRVTEIKEDGTVEYDLLQLSGSRYGSANTSRIGPGKDYEILGTPTESKTATDIIQEWENIAIDAVMNPAKYAPDQDTAENSSTALALASGPDRLEAAIATIEKKKSIVRVSQWILESKKNQLSRFVSEMAKTITKMKKVIAVFELYLGVDEEVVQLQSGNPESGDAPVSIRQLILFMDEVVGDPSNGGIDFQRVDDFDNWVIADNNYETLLPERKGVLALRPSRQKRPHFNLQGNVFFEVQDQDRRCYLLIRNGDNIYRIFTGMASVGEYFIPPEGELASLLEDIENGYGHQQEKAEDIQLSYSQKALMIQGLVDRTDVFSPISRHIKITESDDMVNFIYDGKPSLTDGHPPYNKWKEEMNIDLKRGSRIIVSGYIKEAFSWDSEPTLRMPRYHKDSYNKPPIPEPGVYVVEEIKKGDHHRRDELIIRYNPKDTIYNTSWGHGDWWSKEREQNVKFIVFREDDFVFSYDRVDLESVEYYLNSHINRKHYLKMIPTLWELRKQRLEELELEKAFVDLIVNETGKDGDEVWPAIAWWKQRTQLKRPLSKDDAKAYRMIKRYLNGAWRGEQ